MNQGEGRVKRHKPKRRIGPRDAAFQMGVDAHDYFVNVFEVATFS